jgi:2-polyprenyl-6-methoxyphenol hydroxylase-like FAD-dependent oxidoreductase
MPIDNENSTWTICNECFGTGRKHHKLNKKKRNQYKLECESFKKNEANKIPPTLPKGQPYNCSNCNARGLSLSNMSCTPNFESFPNIAIIGGGIGGVALAVACLHRGIPFTIYERDNSFTSRAQGYGLTLQQASKAIEGFGITNLKEKIISTRHVVHQIDGSIIGEWGLRKLGQSITNTYTKRSNIHIARQYLRSALIEQLGGNEVIKWGHQLIDINDEVGDLVELKFEVNGEIINQKADLVVGADGIRSTVRKLLIGDNITPLQYLGCIVVLGICKLSDIKGNTSDLLDSETVFQTANGNERIYIMPFDSDSVMWQLSFPMDENEAQELSNKGSKALKEEAIKRIKWHNPIPQILVATMESQITGYPVYDRSPLNTDLLKQNGKITLIGDAAHPMSPFKGQGANQALLDSLLLARSIYKKCKPLINWRIKGIRESVLNSFETEMLERSKSKVKDSADAAKYLHSDIVLKEGNFPRGHWSK